MLSGVTDNSDSFVDIGSIEKSDSFIDLDPESQAIQLVTFDNNATKITLDLNYIESYSEWSSHFYSKTAEFNIKSE